MNDIEIRLLESSDDRSRFKSGNVDLDRFLQRFAGQNQFKHHIGTTYVAVSDSEILGYATVSASHIEVEDLPPGRLRRGLPAYPLPVLRLARLAVSVDAQGKGIGSALLRAVFHLAHELSVQVGCIGVVVDAKAETRAFYHKLGFMALEVVEGSLGERPSPTPMFLSLGRIPGRRDP